MTCSCHPPRPGRPPRIRKGTTRRDVLRLVLSGAGLAALGPVVGRRLPSAHGAPIGHKVLVVVYMDGGCDTLNMVVPDTLPSYFSRRPTIAIPTASSLPLAGTSLYRLHPSMDRLRDLWDAGDAAFVHRVGYPVANLSHFESQDVYAHAVRGSFAALGIEESGWIARYAGLYAPTPMGAVSVGMGRPAAFVGGTSNPLQVSSLAAFAFARDAAYPDAHAYRMQVIADLLAAATTVGTPGEVRDAIDQAHQLSDQVQAALAGYTTYLAGTGVTYANQAISRNLKDVAALIHGGFETRVFYTGLGGFDTHGAQGAASGAQATLLQRLDDALGSFAADMQAMGQWQNVVVAVFTEFGRRNYQNASDGTDHGAGYSMTLVGGAVNPGSYGTDLTEGDLAGEFVTYDTDFRDVWREVVADHLGADPAPVFPESQPISKTLGVV